VELPADIVLNVTVADLARIGAVTGQGQAGAALLLQAYWHVHSAELILEGVPPRDAQDATRDPYHQPGVNQGAGGAPVDMI